MSPQEPRAIGTSHPHPGVVSTSRRRPDSEAFEPPPEVDAARGLARKP